MNLPLCPSFVNEKFQKSSRKSVQKRGNLDHSVDGKLKFSMIFFENRKSKAEIRVRRFTSGRCDSLRQKSCFSLAYVRAHTINGLVKNDHWRAETQDLSDFLMICIRFQCECLDGLVSNFHIKFWGAEVQDYNFWNLHLFLHNSWICTFYRRICTNSSGSALFRGQNIDFRTRIAKRGQRAVWPGERLLREHILPQGTCGVISERMMLRRAP